MPFQQNLNLDENVTVEGIGDNASPESYPTYDLVNKKNPSEDVSSGKEDQYVTLAIKINSQSQDAPTMDCNSSVLKGIKARRKRFEKDEFYTQVTKRLIEELVLHSSLRSKVKAIVFIKSLSILAFEHLRKLGKQHQRKISE